MFMNKIPNIILPAHATMDGRKITIYPSFTGHVTFTFKDGFNRDYVPPGRVVVFDDFPDRPVMLDKVRICWIPA